MRRFEMTTKFWEIEQKGPTYTVRFGKLGTAGQTQTKHFGSPAEAKRAADAITVEKIDKGYVEVGKSTAKTVKATKSARPAKAVKTAAPTKTARPAKAAMPEHLPAAILALCKGELVTLGELAVEGPLIIGDPLLLPDGEVVKVKVAAGEYGVGAIEGVSVRGREVRGLLALRRGDAIASVRKLSGHYGVDGGLGGFWTKAVEKAWSTLPDDVDWHADVVDPVMKDVRAAVISFGGAKLAAGLSGRGDGNYPVYACNSAKGELVGALTVFIPAGESTDVVASEPSDVEPAPERVTTDGLYFADDTVPFVRDAAKKTVLGEIELDAAAAVGDVLAIADGVLSPFGPEVMSSALRCPPDFAGRYEVRLHQAKTGAALAVVLTRLGAVATKWNGGDPMITVTGLAGVWASGAEKKVRRAATPKARLAALRAMTLSELKDVPKLLPSEQVAVARLGGPASHVGVAVGQDAKGRVVGLALTLSDRRAEDLVAKATTLAAPFLG